MTAPLGRQAAANDAELPAGRSSMLRVALGICAALLFIGFAALGTWQVQRLHWKQALIDRVEARVHAAPVEAPRSARWADISAQSDEYRRVAVRGTFLHDLSAKVLAATELGSGYWLLTPLRRDDGTVVLVNRGFIPVGRAATDRGNEPASVTGLLRISEPGGGFLRNNDASADRWYSRDVPAIAASRRLTAVAPYFIDAQAVAGATAGQPVGGLTVVSFHNNHAVYAFTWYALALMTAAGAFWVVREERRRTR